MKDPFVIPIDPSDLFDRLARVASTDDVEAEVLERLCPDDELDLPVSTTALVEVTKFRVQRSGLVTPFQHRLISTHPHITKEKHQMGFSPRYEAAAQAAAAVVGRFEPTDPQFSMVDTADSLAERFAAVADPNRIWSPERRLHEWCQAVHDMAKKDSATRIDRVTIDTTNGWNGVPGATQVLFVQLVPESINYRKGEREAAALVYATPTETRLWKGKTYSEDFQDLILGVVEYYPSDMAAIERADELRRAIRTLVDSARNTDFVPDAEVEPVAPRVRRYGV